MNSNLNQLWYIIVYKDGVFDKGLKGNLSTSAPKLYTLGGARRRVADKRKYYEHYNRHRLESHPFPEPQIKEYKLVENK